MDPKKFEEAYENIERLLAGGKIVVLVSYGEHAEANQITNVEYYSEPHDNDVIVFYKGHGDDCDIFYEIENGPGAEEALLDIIEVKLTKDVVK